MTDETPSRLRRLFPPNGEQYELFNLALWIGPAFTATYILGRPSPTSREALEWLLGATPWAIWATAVLSCFIFAAVASYRASLVPCGYAVFALGCAVWCGLLVVGSFDMLNPLGICIAILYGGFAREALHKAGKV